ncbi:hypothetical protein QFC20_000873 [Naganishia adeliensis]|uniref:Uncharacterized protein n=1 Tax=Naganishia adeliensis TaxID=92952 RepID=A0ACC2WXJ8_9TREE|nr:hypothetical protein QFC20_000873 [Naganishia adeliensis]
MAPARSNSTSSKAKAAARDAPPPRATINGSRKILTFRGHQHLRQRVVLSVLSGKSVKIEGIRQDEVDIGLRDFEVSFLRLVEKITNGTTIEISYTGTTLLLHPGLLPGGTFTHTCPLSRSVGYFLEPLVVLGCFGKRPLEIRMDGITSEEGRDLSVDMIRTVTLPHLHLFGIEDGLELQIKKRGAAPLGGGQVLFRCPVVKNVKTLNFVDPGKIKRIRGISWSTRVSPQFANRMVEAARSVLNRYIPDIYLYTDVYKGEESGKSSGYGLTLLSLSNTSAIHSAETISVPAQQASNTGNSSMQITDASSTTTQTRFQTPEELALHAARLLLDSVAKGGCVDEAHQWLVLLMMVLGSEDVGRCRMGALTPFSIQYLRDLHDFFGVRFKIASMGTPLSANAVADAEENDGGEHEGGESDSSDEESENGQVVMGMTVNEIKEAKVEKHGIQNGKLRPPEFMVSCVGIGYGNINRSAA